MQKNIDVLIIGAGAAGLMCAIEVGKRGRSVVVVEHNSSIGKKIRISGGGRCNFTNMHATDKNFVSNNPHFAKSALSRFSPQDFCNLVEKYKILFHEKKLGQLFCNESSQNIIDLLRKECNQHTVEILLDTKITNIEKKEKFSISTTKGSFECESLVIATGGLSIPTLGATDLGYKIASQFNLKINVPRAALVPLTLNRKDLEIFQTLSGVSLDTLVTFEKISFRENILFTHKGLSGPVILQISTYWKPKKAIHINLIPEQNMLDVLKSQQTKDILLKNFLKQYLPSRLADVLCDHYFENRALNRYSLEQLQDIGKRLNDWEFIPEGTEGYAKAEVTAGGIDTDELSSKTMEAKKVPGLYFIGEVVDVTGHLGGFNFQWAWASGFAAGQYA
jgi:predicted Rossmann fold flavoprotein